MLNVSQTTTAQRPLTLTGAWGPLAGAGRFLRTAGRAVGCVAVPSSPGGLQGASNASCAASFMEWWPENEWALGRM